MKTFKRTLKGDKHHSGESFGKGSATLSPKSSASGKGGLYSPTKVVKALYDYQPQGPGELPFTKGDFFHVVNEDDEDWYEVSNPATNLRGMVPIVYFEVFGRSRPAQTSPQKSPGLVSRLASTNASNNSGLGTLYAKVMYDFHAERPEELDVSAGENLIICAHHEQDWFIAKPIGRLGGPGLVPVGFVQVNDLVNGAADLSPVEVIIQKYNLPTVREWKEKNAKYKASSIPLGDPLAKVPESPRMGEQTRGEPSGHVTSPQTRTPSLARIYVVDVSVESFALHNDKYWYLVKPTMSNGVVRSLCRYYEDFFDFQIKLLDTFPDEAGKTVGVKRILPFIPGPLMTVNESISAQRRNDFDVYVKKLISLPTHVAKSELVVDLFALRDGDREFAPDQDYFELPNPQANAHASNAQNENRISDRNSHSQRSIGRALTYQQDRLSQYLDVDRNSRISMLNGASPHNSLPARNSHPGPAGSPPPLTKKTKVKVYFEDDIYALLVAPLTTLTAIKSDIAERIGLEGDVEIHVKDRYDADPNDGLVADDELLRAVLAGDKVKLVIVEK
ncbi:hypothetical protein BABINDRAFT_163773 [Babjeviella inositovora NRRL Y-12698]|uniref:Bud emergence protein 1 n=1 Tax=Babjeviella inositovora NRRL Y-12698 TaxID=984486 RepID=A0A1E3QH78_9ASCO|nr:uncharacterized protein BABINDRAFT_163773 [Babjeviella inositovora NRRL Y-12698]ODQ77041.1 hypothetical protein BABINDRAFT_163773 [Babjeviella inositovora NRRL Y-12698]